MYAVGGGMKKREGWERERGGNGKQRGERDGEGSGEAEKDYVCCCGTHRALLRVFWNDAVLFVSMDRIRSP